MLITVEITIEYQELQIIIRFWSNRVKPIALPKGHMFAQSWSLIYVFNVFRVSQFHLTNWQRNEGLTVELMMFHRGSISIKTNRCINFISKSLPDHKLKRYCDNVCPETLWRVSWNICNRLLYALIDCLDCAALGLFYYVPYVYISVI